MLEILFVTDFVCPFCIVGKAALIKAIKQTGIEAEIKIQPMELTEEPKERVDTYHDEVRKAKYKVQEAPAKALGIDMKFPPSVVPRPYTRLAWEGWFYAKKKGLGHEYSDLMYYAYFVEEADIGDIDVLVKLAESIGLDGAEYRKVLEDGTYYEAEKMATSYSRNNLEVKGIPTIFINGQRVKMSEYTVDEAVKLLTELPEPVSADEAGGCGPDGCGGPVFAGADGCGGPAPKDAEDDGGCGPDGCHF